MRRTSFLFGCCLLLAVPLAVAAHRPAVIELPDGFQPEGIATDGNVFFVGSIPTGDIVRGDLRTGTVSLFVDAPSGRNAIGLSLRDGLLFVAGGGTGQGYVYDASDGSQVAVFQLTAGSTFVNDVVATRDAAYFTDSVNPRLYVVPFTRDGFGAPQARAIAGDLVYTSGFNANGIDATPDGSKLVIVQSNTGRLFTADPATAVTEEINLGGETVTNGDGILLQGGGSLWVVENRDNLLTLVDLDSDLAAGTVVGRFTHPTFDVPTTVADAGNRLALVNARFGTAADPPTAEYWVTQIERPA